MIYFDLHIYLCARPNCHHIKAAVSSIPASHGRYCCFLYFSSYILFDKHGVPEAEETIPLPHRFLISCQYMLLPRQCGHKHDKRRFRQMEIRDQRIQDLKPVSRIDKDLRPSAARLQPSIFICRGLHRTAARRPHADHTVPALFRAVDLLRRLFFNSSASSLT